MSRLVYFDCASGAAGDMLLGALVDLGLSVEWLREQLRKLPLDGYRLEVRRVERSGLQATKVDVRVAAQASHAGHAHAADHGHRGLREILALLERSALDESVTKRSAQLFRRLAEAEAAVHGTTPEEVHFHEVGAVDSIVDVVGGVLGLAWLGAERFVSSPLNVGTGQVRMAHGVFPVPAPATARLVLDVPVYGAGEGELLTPTGALLVTGHAMSYGPLPLMRPTAVGYGAGSRQTPGAPNVLRLVVGESGEPATTGHGPVMLLETQVDDASPQILGALVGRVLEAGALDAYLTPVQMKKGRPGVLITVVAEPALRERLEELLFSESTTLGLRHTLCERTTLSREVVPVATPYGQIGVKLGRRAKRVYNAQPEFDDCQAAAARAGVAVKEVWAAALAAWRAREGER